VIYQNDSRHTGGRYFPSVGRQKRRRNEREAKPVKDLTRFELARRSIKIRLMPCDISHTVLIGACEMRVVYKAWATGYVIDNRQITHRRRLMSAKVLSPNTGTQARHRALPVSPDHEHAKQGKETNHG
jgi:hypothetical protein